MSETVLPRRAVPQPKPNLNPGGDCGPCVLGGLTGRTVPQVYDLISEGKPKSLGHQEMQQVLRRHSDLFDRYIDEAPIGWMVYDPWHAWGLQPHHQAMQWFRYVRMAIDAGYYGIACVSYRKEGPHGPGTDHWVLICGTRERRPPPGEGGPIHEEILVSCSATTSPDEEWVRAWEFLRHRGGFNLFLVRPR